MTERGNKLTLRIPPSFTGYIEPFIKTTMGKYGKKLGMAGADHDYAKAWAALFKPAWEAGRRQGRRREPDVLQQGHRLLQRRQPRRSRPSPTCCSSAAPPSRPALVVKQARELGFKGGFMIMDQAKLDEMAQVLGGYEHARRLDRRAAD